MQVKGRGRSSSNRTPYVFVLYASKFQFLLICFIYFEVHSAAHSLFVGHINYLSMPATTRCCSVLSIVFSLFSDSGLDLFYKVYLFSICFLKEKTGLLKEPIKSYESCIKISVYKTPFSSCSLVYYMFMFMFASVHFPFIFLGSSLHLLFCTSRDYF